MLAETRSNAPRPPRTNHTKAPEPGTKYLHGMSDRSFQQLEAFHKKYNKESNNG